MGQGSPEGVLDQRLQRVRAPDRREPLPHSRPRIRAIRRTASVRFPARLRSCPTWRRGRRVTLDQIETTVLAEFKDPRIFVALGRGAVGSGRLRSEAFSAKTVDRQLAEAKAQFATSPRHARVDSLTGKVSISAILSWRSAAFIEEYADDSFDLPKREPIERAVDRLPATAPSRCRGRVHQKELLSAHLRVIRLAAQRPHRAVDPTDGPSARWQSGNRHRFESGVGVGEREGARGRRVPRVPVRKRRRSAGEGGPRAGRIAGRDRDRRFVHSRRRGKGRRRHPATPLVQSTSWSTTSGLPKGRISSIPPTPSGRKRSTKPFFLPFECRASSFLTCGDKVADRL